MKKQGKIPDLQPSHSMKVQHLGDEWSLMEDTEFPYGIRVSSVDGFLDYINENLISKYLPVGNRLTLMEIGPGGGRITRLLLPLCERLYTVDISPKMLERFQARFRNETRIECILTDGWEIPRIPANSLDAVLSFDTFVHLEPSEIFRYLEITRNLLKTQGVGIIHFSDVETPIGFKLFRSQNPTVVQRGPDFSSFSVMTKGIMQKFLRELGFEIVAITNEIVPRDAIAIFRRI